MPSNTTRLQLPSFVGGDQVSSIAASDQAAKAILDKAVVYSEGAFVSRPAPGTKGTVYKATDDTTGGADGTYYLDSARAFTANTTSGSPTLASVSSFTGIAVGSTITGAGIPAATTVSAMNTGAATITLSANATATATGVSLTSASWNQLPVTLGGKLTVTVEEISASTGGELDLRDTAAGSNLKRSRVFNKSGKTTLDSINDANTTPLKTGLSMDHATGVVDFPNGITGNRVGFGHFSGYRSTAITLAGSPIPFNAEEYDSGGNYDPATGYVLPGAGEVWRLSWAVTVASGALRTDLDWYDGSVVRVERRGATGVASGTLPATSAGTAIVVGDGTKVWFVQATTAAGAGAAVTDQSSMYFQGERVG